MVLARLLLKVSRIIFVIARATAAVTTNPWMELLSILLVILVCFQARLIQFFFLYPPCAASSSLLVADAVVLYVVYTPRCIQTAVHSANKVTEYIFALNSLGLTLSHYFHLDNNYK